LILATDITQQAGYLSQLRESLSQPTQPISMSLPDNRLFILKIALKCADLGNPCRSWELSRRWSEQICSEFYRQGDFERQLNLAITPICNRYQASMARIQTGECLLRPTTSGEKEVNERENCDIDFCLTKMISSGK
jgi:hypothetical protein